MEQPIIYNAIECRECNIPKGWGHEIIFENNELYCGKLLNFKQGAKFSMHYHMIKDETWYVLDGHFVVKYLDTADASLHTHDLRPGDTWHNPPLVPHQVVCYEAGTLIEVSTPDSVEDNYRVGKGDSQK